MAHQEGMEFYRKWIGGNWPEVQKWQYDFLQHKMFHYNPSRTFLDVGCGSLRLGSRLIRSHDPDKYIGLDVSQELIDYGLKYEMRPSTIEEKRPRFIVNDQFDLSSLGDEKVDIAWCFAVFQHCPDWLVKQALNNIKSVLADDGVIFSSWSSDFGYGMGEQPDDNYKYDGKQLTFVRYEEEIEALFDECGLTYEHRGDTIKNGFMIRSVPKERG